MQERRLTSWKVSELVKGTVSSPVPCTSSIGGSFAACVCVCKNRDGRPVRTSPIQATIHLHVCVLPGVSIEIVTIGGRMSFASNTFPSTCNALHLLPGPS